MENLIVKQGGKCFGSHVLFEEMSYTFEPNYFYALIGPSGSGKSTLLNCLGKLDNLSFGTIQLGMKDISEIKPLSYFRETVGFLFQNYALIEEETVKQNLNIVKKFSEIELIASLERYGLSKTYLNRKVFTLSGGEAQRVALARLKLQNPPIILADEPTGALDEQNSELVLSSLLEMCRLGKIVIVATHDSSVVQLADQVVNLLEY